MYTCRGMWRKKERKKTTTENGALTLISNHLTCLMLGLNGWCHKNSVNKIEILHQLTWHADVLHSMYITWSPLSKASSSPHPSPNPVQLVWAFFPEGYPSEVDSLKQWHRTNPLLPVAMHKACFIQTSLLLDSASVESPTMFLLSFNFQFMLNHPKCSVLEVQGPDSDFSSFSFRSCRINKCVSISLKNLS